MILIMSILSFTQETYVVNKDKTEFFKNRDHKKEIINLLKKGTEVKKNRCSNA